MTQVISLTKGAISCVSDDDYSWLIAMGNWCLSNSGYAVHYTVTNGKRKTLLMHRLILDAPRHLQVDHIDRNRLNNQRENLRFATRSQNQANKHVQRNNTSAYKGVSWNKGKWEARIRFNGERLNLGRFHSPIEAALVYDTASRMLYDAFAGCNFPDRASSQVLIDRVSARLARRK